MTENLREKILHFFSKMEAKAENTKTKLLCEEIPSMRGKEFFGEMLDILLYADSYTIEGHLEACLYQTLCGSGKNTHVHEDALYVAYVDEKNESRWQYVFGETLLNCQVRFPTKEQVHDYWEWHVRCYKKQIRVPMLEREVDISLKQMFLEQTLARVCARADMLYAPISSWRKAVEWHPAHYREETLKRKKRLLRMLGKRRIFLIRTGAPLFMIQELNQEILNLEAILEAMRE